VRVELAQAAERDLRQIVLLVGTENPGRVVSFALDLRSAARELGDAPDRFQFVAAHGRETVRKRSYRNYQIFFRHDSDRVIVLRIVHATNLTADFPEGSK